MNSCRILIIDDDLDDVEILTDALHYNGINNFHCVHTAIEAFTYLANIRCEEELPRLIVTDLYLPIMSGMDFISDLKKTKHLSSIPVVILSNLKAEQVQDIKKEFEATDYIRKPNSYNEYLEIAHYLNKRFVA